MVRSVHDVARYTKICIKYNSLDIQKTAISGKPLFLEVSDIANFTAHISHYFRCEYTAKFATLPFD
jgi:hypothetical protein